MSTDGAYAIHVKWFAGHLSFFLSTSARYALLSPWRGGIEDCDKALQYLEAERDDPGYYRDAADLDSMTNAGVLLETYLSSYEYAPHWREIALVLKRLVAAIKEYAGNFGLCQEARYDSWVRVKKEVEILKRRISGMEQIMRVLMWQKVRERR